MAADGWLIIGAGGHGRVVADAIRSAGGRVSAWADLDADRVRREGLAGEDEPVWPEAEAVKRCQRGEPGIIGVALGIGDNRPRLGLFGRLDSGRLPPVIHAAASVSAGARVGSGTVILSNTVVGTGASLGEVVIVNSGAIVEHDCDLGAGVHVAPGATLCGGVRIGSRTLIGAGAVVLPGVHVGEDVTVGAGAVVTAPVPSGVTVVGVPARIISTGVVS